MVSYKLIVEGGLVQLHPNCEWPSCCSYCDWNFKPKQRLLWREREIFECYECKMFDWGIMHLTWVFIRWKETIFGLNTKEKDLTMGVQHFREVALNFQWLIYIFGKLGFNLACKYVISTNILFWLLLSKLFLLISYYSFTCLF